MNFNTTFDRYFFEAGKAGIKFKNIKNEKGSRSGWGLTFPLPRAAGPLLMQRSSSDPSS